MVSARRLALTVMLALGSVAGCTVLTGVDDLSTAPLVEEPVPDATTAADQTTAPPGKYADAFVSPDTATDGAQAPDTAVLAPDGGIALTVNGTVMNYDVFVAAGSPKGVVSVQVTVAAGATIGSSSPNLPAFTTGAFVTGSDVVLINRGNILGAGGRGGSGGNGGSGSPGMSCSRPGEKGGPAIKLTMPIEITNLGLIAGGGGGGGGASAINNNAGGGGGDGSIGGPGGAAATALSNAAELAYCNQDNGIRTGTAGSAGGATPGLGGGGGGGGGFIPQGGKGGAYGRDGDPTVDTVAVIAAPGGAAGNAIKRNGNACNLTDGPYATGTGPLRGPIGN